MTTIDLMIDEENELTFQVQIEGTRPGKAKCRLMLESKGMSLAFEGQTPFLSNTTTLRIKIEKGCEMLWVFTAL